MRVIGGDGPFPCCRADAGTTTENRDWVITKASSSSIEGNKKWDFEEGSSAQRSARWPLR